MVHLIVVFYVVLSFIFNNNNPQLTKKLFFFFPFFFYSFVCLGTITHKMSMDTQNNCFSLAMVDPAVCFVAKQ